MTDNAEAAPTAETEKVEQVEQQEIPATTGAGQGNPQSEADAPGEQPEKPTKRSAGIEKRIGELTAKRREAEQRAADAERRLAEALGGQQETGQAPSLDDFTTYDDFVRAQAKWAVREANREHAESIRKAATDHRREVLAAEFTAKVDDARSRIPDYEAVAFNPAIPVTEAMKDAILESDISADVAYYLGKNPDVAARLTQLSPMAVAREVGRIEAAIMSQPVVVKATSAPEPIRPVGQRSAQVQKDPDQMTEAEYWAWRKAQKSAR